MVPNALSLAFTISNTKTFHRRLFMAVVIGPWDQVPWISCRFDCTSVNDNSLIFDKIWLANPFTFGFLRDFELANLIIIFISTYWFRNVPSNHISMS